MGILWGLAQQEDRETVEASLRQQALKANSEVDKQEICDLQLHEKRLENVKHNV